MGARIKGAFNSEATSRKAATSISKRWKGAKRAEDVKLRDNRGVPGSCDGWGALITSGAARREIRAKMKFSRGREQLITSGLYRARKKCWKRERVDPGVECES
ncbi:hypothetical protein TNCV_3848871 [Trichonephila clavipes]|uniref:Uncharacterized protein n=1 Tax=Trichonephila clavipes TaxID=2585209 RepID=A0A8X6RJ16_TRICX|nr:hypothetical protein TNCV_3848871 [Trichonephila clavipes]